MIDSTRMQAERSDVLSTKAQTTRRDWTNLYVVATIHRAETVDQIDRLRTAMDCLSCIAEKRQVKLLAHPRLMMGLESFAINISENIELLEPMPHLPFLELCINAFCVVTDSGGLQEESVVLGIPCATLREETERPCTVETGLSQLVGLDIFKIEKFMRAHTVQAWQRGFDSTRIPYWDGYAASRISSEILEMLLPSTAK